MNPFIPGRVGAAAAAAGTGILLLLLVVAATGILPSAADEYSSTILLGTRTLQIQNTFFIKNKKVMEKKTGTMVPNQ